MSEPVATIACVAVLLPPDVVPPLTSLTAPVVTVTDVVPVAVGVPLTGHEMLAPGATVAGAVGVQVPTLTPGGRPLTEQVALVALAVAVALLVHFTVPAYGVPTIAVVGRADRSGVMSEPTAPIVTVAVLLAGLPSLVAPVVPAIVLDPTAVGVPETVQVILAPGATVVGGIGAQV